MLCAAVTTWFVRLPLRLVLLGAALAGLPSLLAVLIGQHWAGALLAVVLFGLWCGWVRGQLIREY
jgi:ribose/xylose/arabinose/galactoside ABC-type transport system permease subunit